MAHGHKFPHCKGKAGVDIQLLRDVAGGQRRPIPQDATFGGSDESEYRFKESGLPRSILS